MKAQREMKKDPKRAVEMIEKVLENEPYNKQAQSGVEGGGGGGGMARDRGVRAADIARREPARMSNCCMNWRGFITSMGESERGGRDLQSRSARSIRSMPRRCGWGRMRRRAHSMKTGGWTQAESYRDLIKDKEAAVSLEQQGRMKLTEESLDRQIAEVYATSPGRATEYRHSAASLAH